MLQNNHKKLSYLNHFQKCSLPPLKIINSKKFAAQLTIEKYFINLCKSNAKNNFNDHD